MNADRDAARRAGRAVDEGLESVFTRLGPPSGPDQIVASTVGSFWYCLPCAVKQSYSEPARRRDLMAQYTYFCDDCGTRIS